MLVPFRLVPGLLTHWSAWLSAGSTTANNHMQYLGVRIVDESGLIRRTRSTCIVIRMSVAAAVNVRFVDKTSIVVRYWVFVELVWMCGKGVGVSQIR